MTSSYDNYMANIIGSSLEPGGNQKRFWSFIRSQRKEMSGIPALEAEGEIYSTDRGKAQALNAQFVSVFTQPGSTSLPDKGPSLYQDIPDLDIGLQCIVKQLACPKVNKAGGPDDVPARILHNHTKDLKPMLTYIMKQSNGDSTLPKDWRKVMVTGIYKKGKKTSPDNYRPVSLTCICCKVMEHVILSHVSTIQAPSPKQHHHQQPTWIP